MFTGSATAMCTPFTDDGVNFGTYEKLIEFQIQNGTDALVVTGTTGEPSTMSDAELFELWGCARNAISKRVPLIIGTGSNNTRHAVELAERAAKAGADALLVVTPYYNKCTTAGLVAHYKAVGEVGLPIIVYNVPVRTGFKLDEKQLCALCEVPMVRGVKEASGDIALMTRMVAACSDRIEFFSGEDGIVTPSLTLGFVGVISVASNILPRQMHELVARFLQDDAAGSLKIQLELQELIGLLFCEVNPIPAKTALGLMGYDMGPFRLPLCDMTEENKNKLQNRMQKMGII